MSRANDAQIIKCPEANADQNESRCSLPGVYTYIAYGSLKLPSRMSGLSVEILENKRVRDIDRAKLRRTQKHPFKCGLSY